MVVEKRVATLLLFAAIFAAVFGNEGVMIGFEETEVQIHENITDGDKLLCVKVMEGELMHQATVTVQYYNQTTVADEDYKEEIISLTFSQNDTRMCFNVSIIDDNKYEQDEVFFANITTNDAQVTLSPRSATLKIKSDDVLTIGFIDYPYEGREDKGVVNITVGLLGHTVPEHKILVKFSTQDISGISNAAKAGVDYTHESRNLILSRESITIDVKLINDNSLEGDEDFKVILQTMDLGKKIEDTIVLSKETAVVTIVDDDKLFIGLVQNVTVMEGRNATLCVDFSNEFAKNFNINVAHLLTNLSTDYPAAVPDEDFFLTNLSIEAISTLHGPNDSLCFNIMVKQDEFVENKECFEVGISLPDSVSSDLMVELDEGKDTAVVCIQDDDCVMIGFEKTEVQIPENIADGVKLLCVKVFEGKLMREARVTVQFLNNNNNNLAIADEDYKNERIDLVISQNGTTCFNVSIIDDNIHEQDEVFFANITTSDPQVAITQHMTTLIIESDDVLTIGFIGDPYEGREGGGVVSIRVGLLGPTVPENEIPVMFSTKDIPNVNNAAKAGVDYNNASSTLFLSNKSIIINVELYDDDSLEGDEDLRAMLQIIDMGENVILSKDTATVTIVDDDKLLIGFTTQKVTVMEGNDIMLCVNFSSEFVTNIEIELVTNLSIIDPAIDIFLPNFTIEAIPTVHGPDKLLCFNVPTKEDEFVEHEECFEVDIIVPNSVSDQFMVELDEGKDTTVVCINDNDRVEIGFVDTEVQVPENIKDKKICVNVTRGQLMREVTVMAQYQNHSANDGKDYRGEMHTLTFSQDTTLVCFNVTILDDFINEEDEFFTISLTTTDQNVTLSQDSINIKIKDDDVVQIGFIGDPFEGREKNGIVTVTFGVLGHTKLEEAVPVFVSATDIPGISNGAVTGVDYKYTGGYLNLSNEYITVSIDLINDNYLEGDEDFKVLLHIMDTGRNIELLEDNSIVTIVDDDSVTIGFEENDTMVDENDKFHEPCLKVLKGELRRTTVVNVSYQDGNATDGEDYITNHPVTFSFSQGHTERCFSFTIRDDTEAEPEESFFITATTGDPQVKLSPSIAKVSIKDNDCPEGSIFNNCGTGCSPTCNQPTPSICMLQCVKGCFCTDNKIKHNGDCISLDQCPTK